MNKLSMLLLTGLLSACSLAPTYERPAMPVPEGYLGVAAQTGASMAIPGWQNLFTDPRLRRLISIGLEQNRDLRVAALRVEEARAQYRIQRADLLPNISATSSATRQRSPAIGLDNTREIPAEAVSGGSQVTNLYTVGIGLSAYEVDLFGRIRNLSDAALDEYLALEDTRRSVELSLVAEIATAYMNQRALSDRMAVTKQTYESRQQGLDLIRQRFSYGLGSELDVSQAETLLETAASDLAALERSLGQTENTLALLIGQPQPGDLPPALPLEKQGLDKTLPAGLPSDLLLRRPDIQAAEARLKASYATIGAARAAFFPSISLTANTGFSSTELSNLFNGGNRSWSLMPQINLPIFTGGRNRAQLDVAVLRKDINVAEYEKSIQTAFKEVADELVSRQPLQRQLQAQERLRGSAAQSLTLAQQRYQQGLDAYLTQLDSQRALYEAENTLIDARLQVALSQIKLFKSLGGGWKSRVQ
jgi:multidrug efflux system outer membrane protein